MIIALAIGVVLVVVIAAMSVLALSVSDCLGAERDCRRNNDQRTIIVLAMPVVAAVLLGAGAAAAVNARRAMPLVVASGAILAVFLVWWELPGWTPLVLGVVVAVAAAILAARVPSAQTTVTRETPPRP